MSGKGRKKRGREAGGEEASSPGNSSKGHRCGGLHGMDDGLEEEDIQVTTVEGKDAGIEIC